ncbi:MAG: nuclear transport factor 2 family protein [Halioglobus sp.]
MTDPRIEELLDRQAIMQLINAYCAAADRHDNERMRSLYHEDAIDDHGAFFKGLAMDFIDTLPAIQGPMRILHHNVTTVNLALDGDYAEGEVYVLAFHQVDAEPQPIDLLIGGRYLDRYEKRHGEWKFSERAVLADWSMLNEPSRVKLDHPMIQGSHIGRPGARDPAYGFFRLLKWHGPQPGAGAPKK